MRDGGPDGERPGTGSRLGPAGFIALIVLFGLFGGATWYAVYAWGLLGGIAISPTGWLFLVLGAVLTTLLGGGLMALLFYSSRKGKDF